MLINKREVCSMLKPVKITIMLLCACLFAFTISFALNTAYGEGSIDVPVLSGDTGINNEYDLGDTIEIPNLKIVYKGKEYNTVPVLYYPDGVTYILNSATLSQPGKYKLVYNAEVNGEHVSVTKEFIVYNSLFRFSGNKSTAYYGEFNGYNGIILNLAPRESFIYNKIIDLSKSNVAAEIIQLFVTPHTLGVADVSKLIITFTDVYDVNNYVNIEIKKYYANVDWSLKMVYVTANCNGQDKVGLQGPNMGTLYYKGVNYVRHKNNDYGMNLAYSLAAYPEHSLGSKTLKISMDHEEKAFFANNKIISDMDDPSMYDTIWEGFTTGEVFLSISAQDYFSPSAKMVITNIAGGDLSVSEITDNEAPQINVDLAGYTSNTLPNAVINQSYKLFNATAYDKYDGAVDVQKRVYFNYNLSSKTQINISNDSFVPKRTGKYTIEYISKDSSGNKSVALVDVFAINTDKTLSIDIYDKTVSGYVGEETSVASGFLIKNNIGNTNVKITATLSSNGQIKYDIDPTDLKFRPLYSGNYTVRFEYSDYIYKKVETYNIAINIISNPIILDDAALPNYLLQGRKYKLPKLYGINMSSGEPVPVEASVIIIEDGTKTVNITDDGYYIVGNCLNVEIKYTVTVNNKSVSKSYPLQVINPGDTEDLDITEFFVVTSGEADLRADEKGLKVSVTDDAVVEFVNMIQAKDFIFRFSVNHEAHNLNAVTIYLTDSADPSARIKIRYEYVSDKSTNVFINDIYPASVLTGFGTEKNEFVLKYNSLEGIFAPATGYRINVTSTVSGEPFKGFLSGKVFLEIAAEDVSGHSEINIIRINNQAIYNFSYDEIEPEIILDMVTGTFALGDTVTLNPAFVADVLDPYCTYNFTISDPDGNYVISNKGETLDGNQNPEISYTFTLNKLGNYTVRYTAYDSEGNRAIIPNAFECIDTVPPVITLTNIKDTGKLNEKIKVADATVTDNISTDLEIGITVKTPDYVMIRLTENSFVADKPGKYIVYYSAYDNYGNMALVQYEIVVC